MPTRVMAYLQDSDDPLTMSIQPPLFETQEERNARLAMEEKAQAISDNIDEELQKVVAAERRGLKPIKILLLGQGESGKSTTLKNFQLMYDPKAFRSERASWRAVIQLNVVRSFHSILDAMARVPTQKSEASTSDAPQSPRSSALQLSVELLAIQARLQPLIQAENTLIRRLTMAGSGEVEATQRPKVHSEHDAERISGEAKQVFKELAINSGIPWKHAFNRLLKSERESFDSEEGIDWDDPDDPGAVIHACAQDMIQLWASPIIQQLLEKQKVRLEELSGFFLDSLERVTAVRYIPTDDDILRARLKTLGVSEHRFKITTNGSIRDWKVYDVGGHRSQRVAWAPYFDDMDAIIFLAPISCFDQVLEEDHKVNRLEDSFKLWTMIVSHPLLKHTNLILFLNKIDILRSKLASGIKLKDFVVSYGDRPNDLDSTTTYLRRKFGGILHEKSPLPRVYYCHFTTVTDTKSTTYILSNLKDMLMRQNLMRINLIS
ncbi:guanine nucleotide binding protein, alpha subunit [Crassisporium funariophilum]|nr:guanine nucleotide binding protein, alpha subunit [Crassisporium funariophilum]